ncbi:MAG TPA: hypothetical protein VMB22_00470 [Verrucomicrobiae bacterium]|nr:hypothetical protein [Verrucomicrobiae bacterium]
MKFLLPLILSLAIAGCSPGKPQSSKTASQSEVFGQFIVTFAVVKIPNNILEQHGCPLHGTNGYYFDSSEARDKFASYVLAHTNEFSFTTINGNCVPIVHTHQQTSVKFILDPKQEADDLEKYGLQTVRFDASIDVQNEDERGNVMCQSFYSYLVHLKEPIGNSTDHGGGITGALEGVCHVGQPGIALLFQTKESSLWALSELSLER